MDENDMVKFKLGDSPDRTTTDPKCNHCGRELARQLYRGDQGDAREVYYCPHDDCPQSRSMPFNQEFVERIGRLERDVAKLLDAHHRAHEPWNLGWPQSSVEQLREKARSNVTRLIVEPGERYPRLYVDPGSCHPADINGELLDDLEAAFQALSGGTRKDYVENRRLQAMSEMVRFAAREYQRLIINDDPIPF